MSSTLFQRILLPGFLFQSVIIAGGYATGRELVEFFLSVGTVTGVIAMLLAAVVFSVIAAITFELARISRSYDYRRFFKTLLGRGWFVYELAYFLLGLLVLAIIGAAAGELVATHFNFPALAGTVILMVCIGLLVFYGTGLIEKVLAYWSMVLYITYASFILIYLGNFGGELKQVWSTAALESNWFYIAAAKAITYAGYNIAAIPVILFCVKHLTCRKDALIAGLATGPIAMIPAFFLFLPMITAYPDILDTAVPADYLLQRLQLPLFILLFYTVIFGTFVETGSAYIHAVNERVSAVFKEKGSAMPQWMRPAIAVLGLFLAIVLADAVGLISLISKGYGVLTWVFVTVYVLPVVTLGIYRIINKNSHSLTQDYGVNS